MRFANCTTALCPRNLPSAGTRFGILPRNLPTAGHMVAVRAPHVGRSANGIAHRARAPALLAAAPARTIVKIARRPHASAHMLSVTAISAVTVSHTSHEMSQPIARVAVARRCISPVRTLLHAGPYPHPTATTHTPTASQSRPTCQLPAPSPRRHDRHVRRPSACRFGVRLMSNTMPVLHPRTRKCTPPICIRIGSPPMHTHLQSANPHIALA